MPSTAESPLAQRHERVMVFIDGSNLYHVLGEVCGRHDLNFGKFAEKVAGDRTLVRTYYYNIRQDSERDPNVAAEQGKFLQTLYETPYLEIRMGISKRHGETMVEKGVDVFMATDLVAFAFMDHYDTAVVVSGDGDFFPAIQTAKNRGKHVEVAAFDNNLSAEAANVADLVIKLNKTYFTGLWSDRRRRTAEPVRASRPATSRASAPEAKVPEPAAEKETATPGTRRRAGGRRLSNARRRPAPGRTESESKEEPARPAPEPATVSTNGSGSDGGGPEPSAPLRRTPARRRVGIRSAESNGNGTEPPRPPALRPRAPSAAGQTPAGG